MTIKINSYSKRLNRLKLYLATKTKEYEEAGGEMWMGQPDEWYEPFTICCPRGHVSHRFLKCEEKGELCLVCQEPIYLCPTNTIEDELKNVLYRKVVL